MVRHCVSKRAEQSYIQASSSNVSTNQRPLTCVAELEESIGALLLLLFPMKLKHWQVNVVEKLRMVFHAIAA